MAFLEVPKHIKNIFEIDSFFLEFFFKFMNVEIINNRIDMRYLNKYYKFCKLKNRLDFFEKTILELSLRGFNFNFLPNVSVEFEKDGSNLIKVKNNDVSKNKEYKKLFINEIKFQNFLYDYRVNNDLFFENIPLGNFYIIFNNFNTKEFIEEFKKRGFQVQEN